MGVEWRSVWSLWWCVDRWLIIGGRWPWGGRQVLQWHRRPSICGWSVGAGHRPTDRCPPWLFWVPPLSSDEQRPGSDARVSGPTSADDVRRSKDEVHRRGRCSIATSTDTQAASATDVPPMSTSVEIPFRSVVGPEVGNVLRGPRPSRLFIYFFECVKIKINA